MIANGKILYVGETVPPAALDLVLEGQGYQILVASDLDEATHVLRARDFEAMVVEESLLHQNREELRELTASHPGMPVLGISERLGR